MRTIFASVIIMAGTLLSTSTGNSTLATAPSLPSGFATVNASRVAAAVPGHWDIRRQELPKKVPAHVEKMSVPDLDPLIDQLIRHAELDSKAVRIMPWVYTTCEELLVADYEDAVGRLDSASTHLQSAIQHLIEKSRHSVEIDDSIVLAKHDIDQAEYTILFLLELALHEL